MTNKNISVEAAHEFIKNLIADRCENYGYNYKDFKRVSNQRSKARSELRIYAKNFIRTLTERVESEDRIISENGRLTYVVGQSENEEITNLMRRLVNPKAKWVS